jgi:hypothetical protein
MLLVTVWGPFGIGSPGQVIIAFNYEAVFTERFLLSLGIDVLNFKKPDTETVVRKSIEHLINEVLFEQVLLVSLSGMAGLKKWNL